MLRSSLRSIRKVTLGVGTEATGQIRVTEPEALAQIKPGHSDRFSTIRMVRVGPSGESVEP